MNHVACRWEHGITNMVHLLLLLLSPLLIPRATAHRPWSWNGDDNFSVDVTTVAVIVTLLILAIIIASLVSIYIHLCCVQPAPPTRSPSGQISVSKRGSIGLDKSVIETFPTFFFSAVQELNIRNGSLLECAVCLNEFDDDDDEVLRLLPKCDHVFHSDCIDAWLAGHVTCPVCRANLVPEQAESTQPLEGQLEMDGGESENPTCAVEIKLNDDEGKMGIIPKGKLPRSHSTGHSLCRTGDDWEKFTLRLPVEVQTQLVARARLKRAASMGTLHPAQSSSTTHNYYDHRMSFNFAKLKGKVDTYDGGVIMSPETAASEGFMENGSTVVLES